MDGPDAGVVLADGDELSVPVAGPSVTLAGRVKRPGTFELAPGDTAARLVAYAGGTTGAGTARLALVRKASKGNKGRLARGSLSESARWPKLANGDLVEVR